MNLGDTRLPKQKPKRQDFLRYIFVIITGTRDLSQSLPKIEMGFEKGNRANHAAPGTDNHRNRRSSADLGSYHDGALPGGRVENPLSQTQ